MILRTLQVQNWGCIRQLELPRLSEGIIVIHGPNRTGKTTLVRALRCGLFDADHNSSIEQINSSRPWSGEGPSRIVIEFSFNGADYRLTKVFSKTKEGKALLERKSEDRWRVEEDASKEASRRVRELLGADKSTAGLNQILWLDQGDIGLPEKYLDLPIQEKLNRVLGVMVTAEDLEFKRRLEQRCETWFTHKTGGPKKKSPITEAENLKQKTQENWEREKENFDRYEAAIRKLQSKLDEVPDVERALKSAIVELEQLKDERERSRDRVQQHKDAENTRLKAQEGVSSAKDALEKRQGLHERWRKASDQLKQSSEKVQLAEVQLAKTREILEQKKKALAEARRAEDEHQETRSQVEIKRRSIEIIRKLAQVRKALDSIAIKDRQIEEWKREIQEIKAPDKQTLKDLRENRAKATQLHARLKSGEWTLTIAIECESEIKVAAEGKPIRSVNLVPHKGHRIELRDRANIELCGFGSLEISPPPENRDLAKMSRELDQLEKEFREIIHAFNENPDDAACLDSLYELNVARETKMDRLRITRQELLELAPEGQAALQTQEANLLKLQRGLLAEHSWLSSWQPSEEEILKADTAFAERASELLKSRKNIEDDAHAAEKEVANARNDRDSIVEVRAIDKARFETLTHDLQEMPSEECLNEALRQGVAAEESAKQLAAASKLTEAELTIEDRYRQGEAAFQEREKRERSLKEDLKELRGFLIGNEGLHGKVALAESAFHEAEANWEREKLEAAAHKKLHDYFVSCRETQVSRVMGPIESRVLEWAHALGLDDYAKMHFGDAFLPIGVGIKDRVVGEPIPFDGESYGTWEQLSLLVRLALGGILAKDEPQVALLDDPLAHTDAVKTRRLLGVLQKAAEGNGAWAPPAGRLQILIFTCHPERFDHVPGAQFLDLERLLAK